MRYAELGRIHGYFALEASIGKCAMETQNSLFYHHLHFVTMRFQSLILLVFVLSLGVLADAKRLTADECKGETECGC